MPGSSNGADQADRPASGGAGGDRVDPADPPDPADPAHPPEGSDARAPFGRLAAAGRDAAFPVAWFLGVAAVLGVTVWASATFLPRNAGYPVPLPIAFTGDAVLEGWMRWDGGWYSGIARLGYGYTPGHMSSVAFFPAYPLAIRAVHAVVPDPAYVLPGIVLTFVCGLASAVLLHRWCRRVLAGAGAGAGPDPGSAGDPDHGSAGAGPGPGSGRPEAVARTAVVLLLLYPYGWYLYGAVYADALFLVCVLAAFLLLEHDRPVLAGLAAVAATAARPVGFGVVLGLVAVVLERRGAVTVPFLDRVRAGGWRSAWRAAREESDGPLLGGVRLAPGRLRLADAGVLVSMTGLGAWMWFLDRAFGDPLLFVRAQGVPGWEQAPGPHTWFKISWLTNLRRMPAYVADLDVHWDRALYTSGTTLQALLVIGSLCLVPAVIRRVGWGYAAYLVGVVGIPLLGTKDWQGTGRYLIAAFPVFVVVAGWLVERSARVRVAALAVSGFLLVFLTSAFARGFYLA